MTTRSPLTFLAGSALVLACACAPGTAVGRGPLTVQAIELSPAGQAIDRVMLRTAAAELEVESIEPAHAQATALARILGGRVEREVVTERSAMLTLPRRGCPLSQLQLTLQRKVILGPLGVVAEKVGWVVEKLFVWRR